MYVNRSNYKRTIKSTVVGLVLVNKEGGGRLVPISIWSRHAYVKVSANPC